MTTQATLDAAARANATGRPPVIFIHGLWLKSASWSPWVRLFEGAGYAALAPDWPGEDWPGEDSPGAQGEAAPETIGRVVDHYAGIIRSLDRRPVLVGHSFGGLIAEILAGRGLSAATVAISPAPFRGVLPLPVSALRSAWPVLRNPGNAGRQVSLTRGQFRYAFGNALTPDESDALYDAYHQPAPGRPVFQAAMANFNPWTEARVSVRAPERGPLLLVSGGEDHTVPPAVVRAAYALQKRNRSSVTDLLEIPGRGHSLTVDGGWQGVAEAAIEFGARFGPS
jgi:non-heme chloroperoxidase